MKKICTVLIFFSISLLSQAQVNLNQKTITDAGVVSNAAISIVLQPDGKTVVLGSVLEGKKYKTALLRFDSSGSLDASFGKNGIDTFSNFLPAGYDGGSLRAIALQPDGKIVAAGTAWYYSGSFYLSNILLMRFNADGKIDSTFGQNGTVRTNINSSTGLSVDDAYSVAMQDSSKIVIAGTTYDYQQNRMVFIRYDNDGAIDNSFGIGGVVLLDINHLDDKAFNVAIQPGGKIVAAGETYISNHSYDVALVRLTHNGTLDNAFGTNGIVTTRIGDGGDVAKKIAFQKDGKIVVTGSTQFLYPQPTDVLVLRYSAKGTVDSSFGYFGKLIINVAGQSDEGNSIIVQPDNKILIGGTAKINSTDNFFAARILPSGFFDSTFGSKGILTFSANHQGDICNGMVLQGNGKFILAGQSGFGASNYFGLARYTSSATPDKSFGNRGTRLLAIGSSEDIAYKMLKLPWDNSILLCGTANGYWTMIKYKANGSLKTDPSFGINGKISVLHKDPGNPSAEPDIAIDSALHKIYISGYTGSFTILRFNEDGSTDTAFGKNGVVNYPGTIYYGGLGVQANHKVLIAGVRQFSTSGYDFIARLNMDGSVDSSFGSNGEVQNLPLTVNSIYANNKNNSILLSGRAPLQFDGAIGIFKLKNNGATDSTFGTNGLGEIKIPNGSAEVFFKYLLTTDASGKYLVSGGVQVYDNFAYKFSVSRFLKNGFPDSSFGKKGLVITDETSNSYYDTYNEGITSFCTGNNCGVVTTGIKQNDADEKSDVVVVVYKNDGTIDSSFFNSAKAYLDTTLFGDEYEGGFSTLADNSDPANTVIYIAGKASNGTNSDFMLAKIIKRNSSNFAKTASPVTNFAMNVSPNPAHGFLNISYTLPRAEKIKLELIPVDTKASYNLLEQNANAGTQKVSLILPKGLTAGVYFLKLVSQNGSTVKKIVVE